MRNKSMTTRPLADLRSPLTIERVHAIVALASEGTTTAYESISSAAKDRNAGVRARVAEALGNFAGRSTRTLMKMLSDRDELVGMNAAESLGRVRSRAAIPKLLDLLRADEDDLVRAYGRRGAGRHHLVAVSLRQSCIAEPGPILLSSWLLP
jgi:HEAT repeat protein